jgi:valyl-tRNA synthetase
MLIRERWPALPEAYVDAEAESEIGWLITLVEEVRSIRSTLNVPNSARTPLTLDGRGRGDAGAGGAARRADPLPGRVEGVTVADQPPAGAVPFVVGEATGVPVRAGLIDSGVEVARLKKEVAAHDKDIAGTRRKLDNPEFVRKGAGGGGGGETANGWRRRKRRERSCRRRWSGWRARPSSCKLGR